MIEFRLAIKNPRRKENFKNLFSKTKKLSRHKFFEFEITRYKYYLLELILDTSWRGRDHAGPCVDIGVFGYSICARIYDHRHWNYRNNKWEAEDAVD